jgi:hypothetical protein
MALKKFSYFNTGSWLLSLEGWRLLLEPVKSFVED